MSSTTLSFRPIPIRTVNVRAEDLPGNLVYPVGSNASIVTVKIDENHRKVTEQSVRFIFFMDIESHPLFHHGLLFHILSH